MGTEQLDAGDSVQSRLIMAFPATSSPGIAALPSPAISWPALGPRNNETMGMATHSPQPERVSYD